MFSVMFYSLYYTYQWRSQGDYGLEHYYKIDNKLIFRNYLIIWKKENVCPLFSLSPCYATDTYINKHLMNVEIYFHVCKLITS